MWLQFTDGTFVEVKTPTQMAVALEWLRGARDGEFAILFGDRPGFLIQTEKREDGSFYLEHHDGSLGSYNLPYSIDHQGLIEAFSGYLLKDDRWRRLEWQEMGLNPYTSQNSDVPGQRNAEWQGAFSPKEPKGFGWSWWIWLIVAGVTLSFYYPLVAMCFLLLAMSIAIAHKKGWPGRGHD